MYHHQAPRMLLWLAMSLVLGLGAVAATQQWPGSTVSVSLYKAHLLSLAGWGGYWLDRALFPYDRPHTHLDTTAWASDELADDPDDERAWLAVSSHQFGLSMLRRAIIVLGCLVCVGLGA